MRKRVQITLAVLLVIIAGVIAWQVLRLREPIYQGRRLSVWLEAYRLHAVAGVETWQVREEQQKVDEAVRDAGTNALPTLLRMLEANDSAPKVRLMTLAESQHFIKIRCTPADELNYRAFWAFGVLRARAQSAVPSLIEIANKKISHASQCYAIAALIFIGPPAKEAIPPLLGWATNTDSTVRRSALNALWVCGFHHGVPSTVWREFARCTIGLSCPSGTFSPPNTARIRYPRFGAGFQTLW